MAVLWLDGFDLYDTSNDLSSNYLVNNCNLDTTYFVSGTKSLKFYLYSSYISYRLAAEKSTIFMGFHGILQSYSATTSDLLLYEFTESGTTNVIKFTYYGPTNLLRLYRNTTLLQSTTYIFPTYSTSYFNIKVYKHSTNGNVQLKINNNLILEYTGNTVVTNAATSKITIGNFHYGNFYIDNLWIADEDVDELYIVPVAPVADGYYTQLTRSTGTSNYENVDEFSPPDSAYNYSNTNGYKDTYKYTDPPIEYGIIRAVALYANCNKTEGDTTKFKPLVRYNNTDYLGDARGIGLNTAEHVTVFDKNPVTDTSWTNAMFTGSSRVEFGVEVVK